MAGSALAQGTYFYSGALSENGGPVRAVIGIKTDLTVPIVGKVGMLATADLGSTGDANISFVKFFHLRSTAGDLGIHLGGQNDLERINATDILSYFKFAGGLVYNQYITKIKTVDENGDAKYHPLGLALSFKRAIPVEENAAFKVTSYGVAFTYGL